MNMTIHDHAILYDGNTLLIGFFIDNNSLLNHSSPFTILQIPK